MRTLVFLIAVLSCEAQSKPEFEVATIKPMDGYGPGGCFGGIGSRDPSRIRCPAADMFFLIRYAFGLRNWEFKEELWMHDQRFEVQANIPPGTSQAEFLLMFQNLLVERFHLTYHRVPGHVQGYELVVAKGGSKLIRSPGRGPDVTPVAPGFSNSCLQIFSEGHLATLRIDDLPAPAIAETIAGYLRAPLADRTGLDGKATFDLCSIGSGESLSPEDEGGPTLWSGAAARRNWNRRGSMGEHVGRIMRTNYRRRIEYLFLLATLNCAAQTTPEFEVATIKPSPPLGATFTIGCSGGPFSPDPTCSSINAQSLVSSSSSTPSTRRTGDSRRRPRWRT